MALVPLLAGCRAPAPLSASRPPAEYRVGAYYFAGWWSKPVPSNYLTNHTTDWRPYYPEREPVVGWYDDVQATVDEEIALASAGGLDFFAFDYYAEVGPNNPGAAENANNGLKYYLLSPNKSLLRFAVLYVNHPNSPTSTWNASGATWVELMRDSQYLRIDSKPVFVVYHPGFMRQVWGSSAAVRAALEALRGQAAAAGIPRILVGGGQVVEAGSNANDWVNDGYDFFIAYSLPIADRNRFPNIPTSYSDMRRVQADLWRGLAAASPLAYVPSVTSGWDARPIPEGTNWLTGRTATEFGALLQQSKDAIDRYATFRLPTKNGSVGLSMIYAWNELSEGGYIVPTKSEGSAYLDEVSAIFSRRPN